MLDANGEWGTSATDVIQALADAVRADEMLYSIHYRKRLDEGRPMPTESEIAYMLCDDDPMVICQNLLHPEGPTTTVWGTVQNGEIGHVICADPPINKVVTAYFPARTQPEKWDPDFISKVGVDL